MSVFSILLFLAILLVLVLVHEFGHFAVAKLTNMRVDEFAFGFPPTIFSIKKGETKYAINSLPLGGYVAIWGENGDPDTIAKTHPRAFNNRPWWAKAAVLIAGVFMNMVLALVIFVFISHGEVTISTDNPEYGSRVKNTSLLVVDAAKESPAYKAGIVPGSTILRVTSAGRVADLSTATSLVSFIGAHGNDAITITYRHMDGFTATTTIMAVYGIVPEKKAIGISLDTVGTVKTTWKEALSLGYERTKDITLLTVDGLKMLVQMLFRGESVIESLSGPVGIAKMVGETSEYGSNAVLTLIAVLSINLAVFNILPFPALDGGRLIVVTIEAIIRKRIPFRYYSWLNVASFVLLILLLVVVTIHDFKV
jgi:regulator of sigma E protease